MPKPLSDLSLWPRMLAISGAIFLVSTGLCGVNALGYEFLTGRMSSSIVPGVLFLTGGLETLGMITGLAGLLIALLAWPVSALLRRTRSTTENK